MLSANSVSFLGLFHCSFLLGTGHIFPPFPCLVIFIGLQNLCVHVACWIVVFSFKEY